MKSSPQSAPTFIVDNSAPDWKVSDDLRDWSALSKDDLTYYGKTVIALGETIRLTKEIDEVITEYGGWPGAFQSGTGGSET